VDISHEEETNIILIGFSRENLYKMRWQYWETAGYNLNNKLKDIYPLLFPGISIWENPGCYAYVNFGPQLNFKYPGYEPVVCDQLKAFWDMGNKALGAKDELYMAIIAQKIPYNEIRDGDRDSARLRIMRAEYGAASDGMHYLAQTFALSKKKKKKKK
jgi:hypothetical protein